MSPQELECPNARCRSIEPADGEAWIDEDSPPPIHGDIVPLRGILDPVRLPWNSILFLSGEPGTGKTSIALSMTGATRIKSTEQTIQALAERIWFLHKTLGGVIDHVVEIHDLTTNHRPPAGNAVYVVDSVSESDDALEHYRKELVPWARDPAHRRMLVAVAQATKAGEYAGSSRFPHLADTCMHLERDDSLGVSAAVIWKNRHGPLLRQYYSMDTGAPLPATFGGVYGVKRDSPEYSLVEPGERGPWSPSDDLVESIESRVRCRAIATVAKPNAASMNAGASAFAIRHGLCFHAHRVNSTTHHPTCKSTQ